MKYAKYIPELNRRETWAELVDRNIAMHKKKYPNLKTPDYSFSDDTIKRINDYNQKNYKTNIFRFKKYNFNTLCFFSGIDAFY